MSSSAIRPNDSVRPIPVLYPILDAAQQRQHALAATLAAETIVPPPYGELDAPAAVLSLSLSLSGSAGTRADRTPTADEILHEGSEAAWCGCRQCLDLRTRAFSDLYDPRPMPLAYSKLAYALNAWGYTDDAACYVLRHVIREGTPLGCFWVDGCDREAIAEILREIHTEATR